jgi:hypothetical protein
LRQETTASRATIHTECMAVGITVGAS